MEPAKRRTITGASAVLLPFGAPGVIDWEGFSTLLSDTVAAGLIPAVNMDTGYGPTLALTERAQVLELTRSITDTFIAGALVDDAPGASYSHDATARAMELVSAAGGTPIVFPSYGLASVPEGDLAATYAALGATTDRFLGFELGQMFHPAGRIWELETFAALLEVPQLKGAKHSSLRRGPELERLAVRNERRPEFMVMTGNDLAIDLVTQGSDYLLGLSAFHPAAFAHRDRCYHLGDDVGFLQMNDLLQYLGQLSFRAPVPGYRHDAAMFLKLRGRIATDLVPEPTPLRPAADLPLLVDLFERIEALLA